MYLRRHSIAPTGWIRGFPPKPLPWDPEETLILATDRGQRPIGWFVVDRGTYIGRLERDKLLQWLKTRIPESETLTLIGLAESFRIALWHYTTHAKTGDWYDLKSVLPPQVMRWLEYAWAAERKALRRSTAEIEIPIVPGPGERW
jgi:hypothetical protein